MNYVDHLLIGQPLFSADKRGKRGRRACTIYAMTNGTLFLVRPCAGTTAGLVFRQTTRPCHLICVHIQHTGLCINGRTAPLRAAVETRKNDGLPLQTEGDELSLATK